MESKILLALNGLVMGLVPFAVKRHLSREDQWKADREAECNACKAEISKRLQAGDDLFRDIRAEMAEMRREIRESLQRSNTANMILAKGMVSLCREQGGAECEDVKRLAERLTDNFLKGVIS